MSQNSSESCIFLKIYMFRQFIYKNFIRNLWDGNINSLCHGPRRLTERQRPVLIQH